MRFPFESPQAMQLNRDIFETMYFGAVEASMEIAQVDGPYSTFEGSPMSKVRISLCRLSLIFDPLTKTGLLCMFFCLQGIFQFDMWGVKPTDRWDWAGLRENVIKHGIRNSLLLAPMPTASTAQILGRF